MEINIENTSIDDFKKICRTCLSEGEMIPLYESCLQNICVIEMLMSCTFVKFDTKYHMPLPEQICFNCIQRLDIAYKFAQQCENADLILRNCVAKLFGTAEKLSNKEIEKRIKKSNTKVRTKLKAINEETETKLDDSTNIKVIIETENLELKSETEISDAIKTEIKIEAGNESDDTNDTEMIDSVDEENIYNKNVQKSSNSKSEKPLKNQVKKAITKAHSFNCNRCELIFEVKEPPPEISSDLLETQTFAQLKIHKRIVKHEPSDHTCPFCNKKFPFLYNLKIHRRVHTKERPYICSYCSRAFGCKRNLQRHMMMHTGERPYKCHQCDRAFIQRTSLEEHMQKHDGQTFICNECGKSLASNTSLQQHIKSQHTKSQDTANNKLPDQGHECLECHRRYKTERNLKQHMLIHDGKQFLCNFCGKSFNSNSTLYEHLKVHTGVRPYSCDECNKSFRHKGTLASHILTHTGERPFKCPTCDKTFTQRSHLAYHKRLHTGQKPYTCTVCGKSFAQNCNLTVHMRIHTKETPHVCSVCGKGFYDTSSLKKHMKGHNKQNIPQNLSAS